MFFSVIEWFLLKFQVNDFREKLSISKIENATSMVSLKVRNKPPIDAETSQEIEDYIL
jgi:hypothetical protein